MGELRDAFRDAGVDLPYLSDTRGPVVVRNTRDQPYEDEIFGHRIPETPDTGGILSDLEVARAGFPGSEQLRQGTQWTLTGLNAPLQELTGLFRNVWQASKTGAPMTGIASADIGIGLGLNPSSQSDLGIAIPRAIRGEEVDIGSGVLGVDPDSAIARERVRRERERGLINGHAFTLGRFTADVLPDTPITEPGSDGYNALSGIVDLSYTLAADPANLVLGGLGKVNQARRLFAPDDAVEAAGGLRGLRRVVSSPTRDAWLNGTEGTRVVEAIASEASPAEIWRATGGRVPMATVTKLADASDPEDVRQILKPVLGTNVRRTDEVWRSPTVLGLPRPSRRTARFMATVPGSHIDTYDLNQAMTQVERWGRNAKVDDGVLTGYLDRLARTGTNRGEILNVVSDVMRETGGILELAGVSNPTTRSQLTRLFRDTHQSARHWFVDEIGDDVPIWSKVLNDGEMQDTLSPHLVMEMLGRYIPIPSYQEVRRVTSAKPWRLLTTKHTLWDQTQLAGELRTVPSMAMWLSEQVWKPLTLLRPAWTVRVIGEEQLRMAAAGYESMFRHPFSYVAWATGRKGGTDLTGEALTEAEDFRRAMSRTFRGFFDDAPDRVRTQRWSIYRNTEHELPEFVQGWADELALLHTDPIARKVASSASLDEVMEWLNGAGRNFRDELGAIAAEIRDDVTARRYLETVADRIQVKTGGNQDLLDLIKTGSIDGVHMLQPDGMRLAPGFKKLLETGYLDSAPQAVKGRDVHYVRESLSGTVGRNIQRGLDWSFGVLMGHPTNKLSRSPEFRQAYWDRVRELAPYADDADALANAAVAAGFKDNFPERLRRLGQRARTDAEPLSIDEIDALAKSHALDQVKGLLYDLSERSQFFDAMRLVFPFGEAWKEVFTRWGTIIKERPQVVRRGQQVIQGARDNGFFTENEFGEEVFVYPGSEFLTSKLLGVPIPMTGRVQGLNMVSNVFPGVGPVVQIPAAWLAQSKPLRDKDWAQWFYKDVIAPYGSPTDEGQELSGVTQVLNFAPPWMRRGIQYLQNGGYDPESDRLWSNTVGNVARYLASTGEYDLSDPAQFQKMMEDAASKARGLYGIRSLTSAFAPSAPSPQFLMETDNGLVPTAMLVEELYELEQDDPDNGLDTFLSRHGDSVVLASVPFSKGLSWGVQPSEEFQTWARKHGDLRKTYPSTYGFFGPQTGSFDYNVYAAQFTSGDREALTNDEWRGLAQHVIAQRIMDKARQQVGPEPTFEQSTWLADIEAALRREYPGFMNTPGIPRGVDREAAIVEIEQIVQERSIRRTPLGKAVSSYLEARQQATEAANEAGYRGFTTAEGMRETREWLRSVAGALSRETPGFGRLYRYVFESELSQVEEEEEEISGAA
jgi:hypothetical protein